MKHLALFINLLVLLPAAARAAEPANFRDQVAPILRARCVGCHGSDSPKGGLTMATAEGLRAGGESGPAIVPGKPEASVLYEMISDNPPTMPKKGSPLTADQVALIRRWIAEGADWPAGLVLDDRKSAGKSWWSLRPLARPEVPRVRLKGWPRSPIDAFILHNLEAKGLSPRPEADRRTLIRRLTYDLHGLPPTPEEVDAFVGDSSADAYERLVDRLLASPRYGERLGRSWLDLVHYGDTHGYDKDKRRDHAWPYRDYVIRAFNDDIPYARFVREQVAGDVLFPDRPEATTATGFLTAGPWDYVGQVELREGTVDKEKTRLLDRDDMLASTISTFVSMTVHCARCHDHKFDPIPQRDYYRLQAVFAGIERGDRPLETREVAAQRLALTSRRKQAADRLGAIQRELAALSSPEVARLDEEIQSIRRRRSEQPRSGRNLSSPSNGYHSAISPAADAEKWVRIDLGAPTAIDEVVLIPARPTDFPDTPGFGFPARFRVELADTADSPRRAIVADESRADFANPGDLPVVIDAAQRSARFVRITASRLWQRTGDYVFALGEVQIISGGKNVAADALVTAFDSIEGGRWSAKALVDGFDSRGPLAEIPSAEAARDRDLARQGRRAESERRRLAEALITPELRAKAQAQTDDLARIDAEIASLPAPGSVYAVLPHDPRPIRLLRRGDVEQPGEAIGPGALACVPGLAADFSSISTAGEGPRRAALADWIADPANVLTWRSIVNRAWLDHFGRGIVETPNDFGRNGAAPSHPELLDWLAVEFRDGGQSLKRLHRLLVRSATYRQSSVDDPTAARIDSENRSLWRMNRRRLDAESVHDAVLAIAGRLDSTMGGPAYEPFRFKDDHSPIYDHEAIDRINSPDCRRRAVYRFVVRSVPDPLIECLDGADPNTNTPVRNTTITALQALALRNDPFVVEQSAAFAERLRGFSGDLNDQIDAAYSLALGRPPRPDEREAMAKYAIGHGLANACRVLLNTNEFVFVD